MRPEVLISSIRTIAVAILLPIFLAPAAAASESNLEAEADCLARTIYFEARDDGRAGMEAVAAVVLNRVASSEFPDDVCAVVMEGGERPPCQFSWWCDGKSDAPEERDLWQEAQDIAGRFLKAPPPDPTDDALYFHAEEVEPEYHQDRELVTRIGDHLFYR